MGVTTTGRTRIRNSVSVCPDMHCSPKLAGVPGILAALLSLVAD